MNKAISMYGSKNGSNCNSYFENNTIKDFIKHYPDEKQLVSDGLYHLHLKRNGKGKFVLFGTDYKNHFYVLGFDPDHKFTK